MNHNIEHSNTLKRRIFFTQGMLYFLIGLSLPLITTIFFETKNLYWSIPSSILPIILGGYFLYYFEIDDEKLIVKNLIFFWIKKEYLKNQIKDISFSLNYGTSLEGNDVITKRILIKTDKDSKEYLLDYNQEYYIDLYYKLKKFKYKHNIFKASLHKKITTNPKKAIHIKFEQLKNKEYLMADNHKLTQNITTTKSMFLMCFGFGFFLLFFILIIGLNKIDSVLIIFKRLSIANIIYITPMLIGLYYLLLFVIGGEKIIIYNRKETTITYPSSKFNKKTTTIPFHQFKFHKILHDSRGWRSHNLIANHISSENEIKGVFNLYTGKLSDDFYSYIIWYMDKRRPLPQSEVFDVYRKTDYEERKKKKFLKPLYSSNISTPEATRKQKTERKKINNW